MSELEEIEAPEEQRRSAIYRHPDRDMIHGLMRRGRDERWISEWLGERYPLEDEFGGPHPAAIENRKWNISPDTVKKYRKKWFPECEPGIDVVNQDIQKIIGRQLPAGPQQMIELDVMEAALAVAQHNLAKAMSQDEDMGMLQPITLEAQKSVMDAARIRVDLAQKLSIPGYEVKPKELLIQQHNQNTNLNVNADIAVDAATGKVRAEDPPKLALMKQLMQKSAAEAQDLVDLAESAAAEGLVFDGDVVEDE